ISLPQGAVSQVPSLGDLILKPEMIREKMVHAIASGDFPSDQNSRLLEDQEHSSSVARSVGRALFDWLRTGCGRARIDSVVQALNCRFADCDGSAQCNSIVAYSIDRAGNVRIKSMPHSGFMTKTIADCQTRDVASNLLPTQKGMLCVEVRDQVSD